MLLIYTMPLPLTVVAEENMGALFTVHYGGHYLTVPELLFEKKERIPITHNDYRYHFSESHELSLQFLLRHHER